MQHALFRLLTAILALKRPYLAVDLGVQRSTHEIGLSPIVRASNRLGVGRPNIGVFFCATGSRLLVKVCVAIRDLPPSAMGTRAPKRRRAWPGQKRGPLRGPCA